MRLSAMAPAAKANKFFITKKELIREVRNDMCHNYYFCFNARFYNDSGTKYYKYRFVLWFDSEALAEYYDTFDYTYKDVYAYADELASSVEGPRSYKEKDRREFIEWANDTINRYNDILHPRSHSYFY